MCFRRKLDTKEALVEEARGAGLDVAALPLRRSSRTRSWRRSGPTWRRRAAVEGLVLPSVRFEGPDGVEWVRGRRRTRSGARRRWRRAATLRPATRCLIRWPRSRGSGARRPSRSRLLCDLARPAAAAELWRSGGRLAAEAGAGADRGALGAALGPSALRAATATRRRARACGRSMRPVMGEAQRRQARRRRAPGRAGGRGPAGRACGGSAGRRSRRPGRSSGQKKSTRKPFTRRCVSGAGSPARRAIGRKRRSSSESVSVSVAAVEQLAQRRPRRARPTRASSAAPQPLRIDQVELVGLVDRGLELPRAESRLAGRRGCGLGSRDRDAVAACVVARRRARGGGRARPGAGASRRPGRSPRSVPAALADAVQLSPRCSWLSAAPGPQLRTAAMEDAMTRELRPPDCVDPPVHAVQPASAQRGARSPRRSTRARAAALA